MDDRQISERLRIMAELLGHGPFDTDKDGDRYCERCSLWIDVYTSRRGTRDALNNWRASAACLNPCGQDSVALGDIAARGAALMAALREGEVI